MKKICVSLLVPCVLVATTPSCKRSAPDAQVKGKPSAAVLNIKQYCDKHVSELSEKLEFPQVQESPDIATWKRHNEMAKEIAEIASDCYVTAKKELALFGNLKPTLEKVFPPESRNPEPAFDRVVLFYVDGAIRKVIDELATSGDTLDHVGKNQSSFRYTLDTLQKNGFSQAEEGAATNSHAAIQSTFLKMNTVYSLFYQNGVRFNNAFTVFPSLTIPSNGTMFTGVDTDRHTIKSQGQFNRKALQKAVSEADAAKTISSLKGINSNKLSLVKYKADSPLRNYKEVTEDGGIPTIFDILMYDHVTAPLDSEVLPQTRSRFFAPAMPIHPFSSGEKISEFVVNNFNAMKFDNTVDMDQAVYRSVTESFLGNQEKLKAAELVVVWLPNIDHMGHGENKSHLEQAHMHPFAGQGQWGPRGRITYATVDQYIAEIIKHVEGLDAGKRNLYVLTSDHGHLGGRKYPSEEFDASNPSWGTETTDKPLTNESFEVGRILAGQLGMNIVYPATNGSLRGEQKDFEFVTIPGQSMNVMAIDNEGYGQAKLYLPYNGRENTSTAYSQRNGKDILESYPVNTALAKKFNGNSSVSLPTHIAYLTPKKLEEEFDEFVAEFKAGNNPSRGNIRDDIFPVDLVAYADWDVYRSSVCGKNGGPARAIYIVKKPPLQRCLDAGIPKCDAISKITYCVQTDRAFYDAEPMEASWEQNEQWDDVLELYPRLPKSMYNPKFLKGLQGTLGKSMDEWMVLGHASNSPYPDMIRGFVRDFFNRSNSKKPKEREDSFGPDLIVTAKEGWNFRKEAIKSTDHGYPLYGSMNVPLMFYAGNNKGNPHPIKGRSVIQNPVRTADLVPTILDALGYRWTCNWFDGKSRLGDIVSGKSSHSPKNSCQ